MFKGIYLWPLAVVVELVIGCMAYNILMKSGNSPTEMADKSAYIQEKTTKSEQRVHDYIWQLKSGGGEISFHNPFEGKLSHR